MNVAFYLHTGQGGHVDYAFELAKAVTQLADCVVVTSRGSHYAQHAGNVRVIEGVTPIDPGALGVRRVINRLWSYGRQPKELKRALRAVRRADRSNICHLQELPTLFPGRMIRAVRRAGFLSVLTVHNVTPHEFTHIDMLSRRSLLKAYRETDRLLVHSEALRVELLKAKGLKPSRVGVVPHPVWPATQPETVDRDAAKSTFLFFGHLRANKGIELFLQALALLGDPRATIRGSGSAEMVSFIRCRITQLGLQQCDFAPGFVPKEEVPSLFDRHLVLVAPYTHFDAQSGITHLAVTYRKASVVTNVGALGDLVMKYGVGEVADEPDPLSLASAMERAWSRSARGCYDEALERAGTELAPGPIAHLLLNEYVRSTQTQCGERPRRRGPFTASA